MNIIYHNNTAWTSSTYLDEDTGDSFLQHLYQSQYLMNRRKQKTLHTALGIIFYLFYLYLAVI